MLESDRQYISELKEQRPFAGYVLASVGDEAVRVQVVSRGEMAFYQQGERALLLEISAAAGVIIGKTIKQWDTGQKVTPAERAVVIDKVSEVLRQLGAARVEIV